MSVLPKQEKKAKKQLIIEHMSRPQNFDQRYFDLWWPDKRQKFCLLWMARKSNSSHKTCAFSDKLLMHCVTFICLCHVYVTEADAALGKVPRQWPHARCVFIVMLYAQILILVPEKSLIGLKRTEGCGRTTRRMISFPKLAGKTNAYVILCDEDVMTTWID